MSDDDKQEIDRLVAKLQECFKKVPAGVNNGGYQTAIKFKEWARDANRALNKRSTKAQLYSLINRYEAYK